MSGSQLVWFRLTFPREMSGQAVVAALSSLAGVAHGTRLIFDLSATNAGLVHRLGVNPSAVETVAASLRAALPSLRLDTVDAPGAPSTRRLLWQLVPATSPIRADDPGGVSAALLSACFPLRADESIRLSWTVRPGLRPALSVTSDHRREGYTQAMRAKLALPGVRAYGELCVRAVDAARAGQLMQRVAAVLRSLSTQHGRLVADPYYYGHLLRFVGQRGRYVSVAELAALIGWPIDGPDLPGLELGAARRLVPSAVLPRTGRVLGLSDYAGPRRPVAITPSAGTRGLYILGPVGSGKTSLIKNLVRDDLVAGRGLAVVETNGDLIKDLVDLIPPERVNDVCLLDPLDAAYAVGFNPFAHGSDPSLVADQLGELFERIWASFWGPRTGQLAHMALLTLARRRGSTLLDLPRLFLDPAFRARVLTGLDDPLGLGPDWQWFERLSEREQATVIAPLLNKVRQFTARPAIRAIMGQAEPALSMQGLMAEQRVLLVHLPKGLIGAETAQLLGCLVLTSLWQATTERTRLPLAERHPFGLYVDEVQDFAAAPIPWDEMFAQGRKYGLSLSVAHQNVEQLPRELRAVILANARSKAVFALSSSDAKTLEPVFAPSLTAADLHALEARTIAAIVALDNGGTAPPVTLHTPPPPDPLGSTAAVQAASRQQFARPRAEVETALRTQLNRQRQPTTTQPVGRQRRSR